jgi:co-chaperonin GroES (HSP10)
MSMKLLGKNVLVKPVEHKEERDKDGGVAKVTPPRLSYSLSIGDVVQMGRDYRGILTERDRVVYMPRGHAIHLNDEMHDLISEADIVAVFEVDEKIAMQNAELEDDE